MGVLSKNDKELKKYVQGFKEVKKDDVGNEKMPHALHRRISLKLEKRKSETQYKNWINLLFHILNFNFNTINFDLTTYKFC